jgi:hypothetical protein
MRRLYHKIYLVFLASLLTVLVTVGLFWRLGQPDSPYGHVLEIAGELAMAVLPPADAPPRVQQQAVERLSQRLHADIGLFDAKLTPIAGAGRYPRRSGSTAASAGCAAKARRPGVSACPIDAGSSRGGRRGFPIRSRAR